MDTRQYCTNSYFRHLEAVPSTLTRFELGVDSIIGVGTYFQPHYHVSSAMTTFENLRSVRANGEIARSFVKASLEIGSCERSNSVELPLGHDSQMEVDFNGDMCDVIAFLNKAHEITTLLL